MSRPAPRSLPRLVVLAAILSVAAAGLLVPGPSWAADPGAGARASVPEDLGRQGRWFAGRDGKVLVLHGTNMVNKLAPYTPDALGFGDEDLRFLADNGFNGIRLGLTWAAVEPRPGTYDDAYIDKIVALADRAADFGLLPVVNFHQDGYSETYGGNGAPGWASLSFGVPGSPLPAPANVLPGASIAFENFWANAAAPDGIGLQDHYAAAWRHVAARFAGDTHTVFELYNEPSPGYVDVAVCALPLGCPLFDTLKLAPFYRKVLSAVREEDADRLVFVEPHALFGAGARTWLPRTDDPQIGFAFHNYCALGLVPLPLPTTGACDALTGATHANAQAQFRATGETLLMNEFGAFDSDATVAALLDRADRDMLSWMHWAYYAQDFGHAATYGLVGDPSKAPEGDNVKHGLLRVLSRPSPRLVAGTPLGWSWNATTSTFQARYSTTRADGAGAFAAGATSEFFLHPRFFPAGYRVQVSGGKVVSPQGSPRLVVAALPGASEVRVTVLPGF